MTKSDEALINSLLTYADCRNFDQWPNYLSLGFSKEHIPELIRMATDIELNRGDSDTLEVWAPAHAWRTLGQLQAEEAIEPLLDLLNSLDDEDDWIGDDLPIVFGMIGSSALPFLSKFLTDKSNRLFSRIITIHSIEVIGSNDSELQNKCIEILNNQLELFKENDPSLNGFLICHLAELKAKQSIPIIKKAYENDCVDYTVVGDLEDVEIMMGQRRHRSTSPNYSLLFDDFFPGKEKKQKKKRKIGRNDPCPCGSGRKYKKCCF